MNQSVNYYLAVESLENWEFDWRNEFRFLGISNKRIKQASLLAKDDIIIVYVSKPAMAFSDARRVIRSGLYSEPRAKDYDIPLNFAAKTEPLVTLPREQWIGLREIGPRISFIGSPQRRFAMHRSFRKLMLPDAECLMMALTAAAFPWRT